MRSPWKVVSELVFRKGRETSGETFETEFKGSSADTAKTVSRLDQADSDASDVSGEVEIYEIGTASEAAKQRGKQLAADVPVPGKLVPTHSSTLPSRSIKPDRDLKRKSKAGQHIATESPIADIQPSGASFVDNASALNAEIEDLRAKLSEHLVVQNAQLIALLKRYDS